MAIPTPRKTQPPSSPPPADGMARQLRAFKIIAAVLLAALLAGIGWFLYVRRAGQPVTVLLDGKPITTVRNYATANALLSEAERAKVGGGYPEESIVRLQKVQWQRLAAGKAVDADPVAVKKLKAALKLHVRAYVILVNGKVSVGLPSDEMAADTLHRVKEHFAQMPPQADLIGEPKFLQRVIVKLKSIDGALAKSSAEAAAPYFWTPPPSKTYTVRRGDTGMVIAHRNHISLSEFISANAGRNINRLTPGDTVNVQKMPLLLTVQVKKRMRREEKIIHNAPDSVAGLRAVTYAVTYTDGLEVSREVIDMTTIEPPQKRTSL